MRTLLNAISSFSYIRIAITAGIVGVLLGIVVTGYYAMQTPVSHIRLGPKFIAPSPVSTKRPKGPVPLQPPQLIGIFPWVGKTGDVVLIRGKYFGENPAEKQLSFGGMPVAETQILDWTNSEIQALIPNGAVSGESIEVTVGKHPPALSLPIAIYDQSTTLQVRKNGTIFSVSAPQDIRTIRWWGRSGETIKQHDVERSDNSDTLLFDAHDEEIQSLLIYDASGSFIPYYVDPEAFGF